MESANVNGTSITYKYNADGLRTEKKVGSTVHKYEYMGDKLFYEKRGDLEFHYRYDVFGNVASITRVKADGSNFSLYTVCNSRGDVEELRRSTGELFARYVYDTWGNVLHIYDVNGAEITSSANFAVQNPFRYRGYYYDTETGLYYLQSRYYDPVTYRFVNVDAFVSTGTGILGHNMFAYCGNNPVVYVDNTGTAHVPGIDACGGTIHTLSQSVDITTRLNESMEENAAILSEYRDSHNYIDTVVYFIDKVKPGGEWDFKSQEDWALNSNTKYMYNDTELRYDDIGNIHYGYVGRVLFSTDVLLFAGGIVQIYTRSSSWTYYRTYFDDPRDQWAIEYGCILWEGVLE